MRQNKIKELNELERITKELKFTRKKLKNLLVQKSKFKSSIPLWKWNKTNKLFNQFKFESFSSKDVYDLNVFGDKASLHSVRVYISYLVKEKLIGEIHSENTTDRRKRKFQVNNQLFNM